MEELQRRQYLAAMGIPLYVSRDAPNMTLVEKVSEEVPPPVPNLRPTIKPPLDRVSATIPAPAPKVANVETYAPVQATNLADLGEQIRQCQGCIELAASRIQTVPGVGNPQANWMIIGEAPGADEDRQGEPFVGRAGQLLNAMLNAMGLAREQVYIANILKCRPPRNRDPSPEEARRCWPFLQRQIELIRPRILLSVGRISAQHLLQTTEPVGRLRGRVHAFGEQGIPLVVTYHPAYLLRSPDQKANAWADLQLAMRTYRHASKTD